MVVEYRILGPLEALVDGAPVPLGGPRRRALLALLLARPGETCPVSSLIDELWQERPPAAAANTIQGWVSELRGLLGREAIETRGRGYAVVLDKARLDAVEFERLARQGTDELLAGRFEEAAAQLAEALALWRGEALADLDGEDAVRPVAARLGEERLSVLERRIEADLCLGRHRALVPELSDLVESHPRRESLRGQLMLALYRSGRQAEALQVYREGRRALVDELGIEPSRELQELERAILRQDPALDVGAERGPVSRRPAETVLVLPLDAAELDSLLSLAEPLACGGGKRLVLARLVAEGDRLAEETAMLAERRSRLVDAGIDVRVAAHTSRDPAADAAALALEQDMGLVLVDAPAATLSGDAALPAFLDAIPCDLAIAVSGRPFTPVGVPIVAAPFGGGRNDWPAIEAAAVLASALEGTLRLIGREAGTGADERDASRLLARASLLVQEVVGIVTEPRLAASGPEGILAAAGDASLLVLGLSERWRSDGIGGARLTIVAGTDIPALLVRRGQRPGGLSPARSLTRLTWSLARS